MSQETLSSLPLIERAQEDGLAFFLSRQSEASDEPLYQISSSPSGPRIPERPLEAGEQYRFHFAMSECIGCKCCVVACNEQNGNPSHINWRRVGEIEGGWYPQTHRFYVSMGCNHCLEPSCLIGCPVDAYKKDPKTGIVQHDPQICIGCQYCT
ncbi:MAG: 4Fe-4S ferredoxin, partial [Acidobacteria bacterium]|nr:4Fe-4S ferredoxin [Acidobacteriota bacterium]